MTIYHSQQTNIELFSCQGIHKVHKVLGVQLIKYISLKKRYTMISENVLWIKDKLYKALRLAFNPSQIINFYHSYEKSLQSMFKAFPGHIYFPHQRTASIKPQENMQMTVRQ